MRNREAARQKQRLDDLFSRIRAVSGDIELQAHWARYLCVQVAGFLEISIQAIFSDYAKKTSTPYVANYVQQQLRGFQNPNMERILELTRRFSTQWADELEVQTDGELKDAIDSIIANRNLIAHGQDSGITYSRIRDYYLKAVKVVELMDQMCDK